MKKILWIACFVLLVTFPLQAADKISIALDCPPDPDKCGTYVWSRAFVDHLTEKGFSVTEYPRDALGGEEEKLDQVSQGLLEVSNSDLAKAGQLDPAMNAFSLPYLWNSIEHLDRAVNKTDLLSDINRRLSKKGIRVLALIPVGDFSGIANTKRAVKTPADLDGLRMRAMSKDQAKYLEAWGSSSVIIPWAEIYNALQTGIADGYLNPAIVPVMFKHTEVLTHFTDAKAMASLRLAIASADWYEGLSEKKRAIVDAAVQKGTAANRAWQKKIARSGLDQLRDTGVTVTSLTPEARARFVELSKKVYTEVLPEEIVKTFLTAADKYR